MELFVTAPIRIDFTLDASQTAYKTSEFYNYFKEVEKKDFTDNHIDNVIIPKKDNENNNSYDNKQKSDLSIFIINLLKSSNNMLANAEDFFICKYFKKMQKFEIKVYDNTVAIVDLRVKLSDFQEYEFFTKYCETKIKLLINDILQNVSLSIDNLLLKLKKFDKNNIIQDVNSANKYEDFFDFHKEQKSFHIMWASCAIKYEKGDNSSLSLMNYWLKDSIDKDELALFKKDDTSHSLKWLKYAFRENLNDDEIETLWNTMFLAQYVYSVIDVIIHNLKLIINESYKSNKKNKDLIKYLFKKNRIILVNQQIESISATSYLHITEYKDIKKFLPREQLTILNNILDAWTFDELSQNTEELLSIAKGRAESIYNKISTKNNFYTDILLTFIGFFAIIDLVLSFSQYSREYTADAMISSRGNGEESFLYYLSSIPIDTFIGSGIMLSVFLLVIYFIYRQKILP